MAIQIMATLNKYAAEAMLSVEVHACTDITGFGFLGHLREMTKASHVNAEIELASVPILKEARQFAAMNVIPGGSLNNLSYVADHVQFDAEIAEIDRVILADAQTSGGLLISLAEDEARKLLTALSKQQVNGYVVGRITQAGEGKILVRKIPERTR
jgi:selenide,water dikinase